VVIFCNVLHNKGGVNQSINQILTKPHTGTKPHTRARRSPSQRHLKGSKPRVAKRRRLRGLKAPTLTKARVEANGEYRVKLAEIAKNIIVQ